MSPSPSLYMKLLDTNDGNENNWLVNRQNEKLQLRDDVPKGRLESLILSLNCSLNGRVLVL